MKTKGFVQVNRGLFVIFIHLAVIESNLGSRNTGDTARAFRFFLNRYESAQQVLRKEMHKY